jgi:hypothetical protein
MARKILQPLTHERALLGAHTVSYFTEHGRSVTKVCYPVSERHLQKLLESKPVVAFSDFSEWDQVTGEDVDHLIEASL